jgi:hypothetical protein
MPLVCAAHKRHNFTLSANDNPRLYELPAHAPNRRKQNESITLIAAEFAAAMNLSCHQAAFPVKLDFIVKSVQLGASLR